MVVGPFGAEGGLMDKLHSKKGISPFAIIVFVLLVLYTVSFLLPMLWGINLSLKKPNDAELSPFSIKFPLVIQNYVKVFKDFKVSVYLENSVAPKTYYIENMLAFTFVYAVCCSFVNIAVTCLVAYITARFNFKICRIIDAIVIVAMILPIVGSMPSELRIMRALGMYNTLWGMIIMKANFVGGTTFLIFNVAFKSFPKDFSEAAEIDGASNFTVMMSIMMPMIKNTFFTMWLLSFISFWNDYQTPLLYFPAKPTLSYGLYVYTTDTSQSGAGNNTPLALATCYLLMLPILVVFLFTSEKLIGNVSVGGLKE